MFSNSSQTLSPDKIRGWILDAYPTGEGEIAVWIISKSGERIRLTDKFEPKIYVSGKQDDIEHLASRFYKNHDIAKWSFAQKYVHPTDTQKTRVLEITLKDYRKASHFTREILRICDYLKYQVHNCDLHADRAYLFSKDLFPLALVEIKNQTPELAYTLQDSVASTDYAVPPMRIMKLQVKVAQKAKVGNFEDPIDEITLIQEEKQVTIDSSDEADKLLKLVDAVCDLDPDIILTHGGDSYLFPYLIQRAIVNSVSDKMLLSRDPPPFAFKAPSGRTFCSYGRTFYKAAPQRLFGRIHIDEANTFVFKEADFDGLIEIARTCRVPLHTAARNSIGSSMSSLQFYQAIKTMC